MYLPLSFLDSRKRLNCRKEARSLDEKQKSDILVAHS